MLAEAFPEFRFAHRMDYEQLSIAGTTFHLVPQTRTAEDARACLDRADRERRADHVNVLVTHPLVTSVERRYPDINEIEVDAADLRADLVLLGHYHFHLQVRPKVWYAGSTDTFSFADDPQEPKGIVLLDTEAGTCRHHAVEGRPAGPAARPVRLLWARPRRDHRRRARAPGAPALGCRHARCRCSAWPPRCTA